jgi:hypothetical protein
MKVNSVFLYKLFEVGVIFLFVGMVVQPVFADEITISSKTIVVINDDLPDLIVEDIELYSRQPEHGYYELNAKIKNIGDSPATGRFEFKVIFYRLILGIFPIPVSYFKDDKPFKGGIINPQEIQYHFLCDNYDFPSRMGIYIIFVEINMDKSVEESNYDNNVRIEKHRKSLVYWY